MQEFLILPGKGQCNAPNLVTKISDINNIGDLGKGQLMDSFYISAGTQKILIFATSEPGTKMNPQLATEMRNELLEIVTSGKRTDCKHFTIK